MGKENHSYLLEWFKAVPARWYGMTVILLFLVAVVVAGIIWLTDKGLEWYWITSGSVVVFVFVLFSFLGYRKVAIERDNVKSELLNLKRYETMKQDIEVKPDNVAIQSRTEAIESSALAWGLWHTGHRMKVEGLIKNPNLQRILVLHPKAIAEVARRVGEVGQERIINEIRETTAEALANKKEIKWYSNYRESSFTIFDTNPRIDEDGILKPNSENAWMHISYLIPNVGIDVWKVQEIRNTGSERQIFAGYFKEYEYIWNEDSIPALQS